LGHIFCPAKELFSTKMTAFIEQYNSTHDKKMKGIVPMGSCGVDIYYNISSIKTIDKYPCILTESGYGEFFEQEFLSGFAQQDYFEQVYDYQTVNQTFASLDLTDPKGIFNIYSAMPYVMLVNTKKLGDRPVPQKISDLLKPCYKNSIVTGHTYDDINELLLLEIYKDYGEVGIRALAKNLGEPMNTVKMVQAADKSDSSYSIYILPYFFAKAAPKKDYLEVIWPLDGALLCPLYSITKKERNKEFDEVLEYLYSKDLGQAMADLYFPHINPDVNNKIPSNGTFQWIGWDYIYEMNIVDRVKRIEQILYDELDQLGLSNAQNL
jgi:ABC-type Fe3+ transport system substrate-binding protein